LEEREGKREEEEDDDDDDEKDLSRQESLEDSRDNWVSFESDPKLKVTKGNITDDVSPASQPLSAIESRKR